MICIILFASININNWTIKQWESSQSYTFGNINIPNDGYLILGRNATRSEFEAHWGNLGSNVVYINSKGHCPMINGDETFSLYNASGIRIDTTEHKLSGSGLCMQRDSTSVNTWNELPYNEANPGSGVIGGHNVGVVITEVSDTYGIGNHIYEFIELYYDAGGSNTPPEINELKRHPINPATNKEVIIRAEVFDNQGIFTDTLYWNVNGGIFTKETRDSTNGSYYYYSINPYDKGDSIEYYISVWDDYLLFCVSDTQGYIVSDSSHFKVLFDYTKDETAANADWIIDDDMPEPYPGIPWKQEDWLGAISDWGYALVRDGHFSVKTLPPDSFITYGEANLLDLSNFDLFIVCEPQIPFSFQEKTAIFNFVRDGGGLFMVGDHYGSDRNVNGWDSPRVWNDLKTTDSFGIHFNVSGEYPNDAWDLSYNYSSDDSVIEGYFGGPNDFYGYWAGTGITLYQMNNSTATGHVWLTPYPFGGSEGVMVATAKFGNGRVAGTGDSSPIDDGTATPGNSNIYDGWGAGSDSVIILNTTAWLVNSELMGITEGKERESGEGTVVLGHSGNNLTFTYLNNDANKIELSIYDCLGRLIVYEGEGHSIQMSDTYHGIYFLIVNHSMGIKRYKLNLLGGSKCLLSE
jgi:hypothetical protein